MIMKRYIGNDVNEAWLKAKMELGNEAVILNTRKIRQKGIFGIFKSKLIEIIVALDESKVKAKNEAKDKIKNAKSETDEINSQIEIIAKKGDEKIHQLEDKVSNIENLMKKMMDEIKSLPQTSQPNDVNTNNVTIKNLFYKNLTGNEIDNDIVKELMSKIEERIGNSTNMNEAASHMFNMINEMIGKPETIKLRDDGKPTVIIFIGPTGVGKTTTLAKIAAEYTLNKKKKVGLITADTYRIAAVDQLKTYADILGVPVNVVYSPSEIEGAIEKLSDKDLVLIDTAGRSTKEKDQFEELKNLVTMSKADETYLVLSSTTGIKTCKEIINSYNLFENYKLIFTKLDETPVTGVILNAKYYTNKNLSYVTTGQNVPDDIEIADSTKLTKSLLGSLNK